jgi:hypothetical protein
VSSVGEDFEGCGGVRKGVRGVLKEGYGGGEHVGRRGGIWGVGGGFRGCFGV